MKRNQWISVNERFPNELPNKCISDYVLCHHKEGRYYVAYWHKGLEYWMTICSIIINISNITHWMPIPKFNIE